MQEHSEQVGIVVPGEELVNTGTDQRNTDIEAEASQKGWKPEAEYDGPKGGFVSAEEFLKREPLFDRIKTQSKELKSLKKTIDAMSSQFQVQLKAQLALQEKQLRSARSEAIEAGDEKTVDKIDEELHQIKNVSVETAPQIPDEVSDWIARNQWFHTDKELNAFAIAHNRAYIDQHPGDVQGSLEATAKAVKKAFPEKFEQPTKTAQSPVAGSEPKGGNVGKNNYSVSRLSEDQKLVYNQWVKRDKFLSHDEYFKGLEEQGELS
jgi:hypothetical protein